MYTREWILTIHTVRSHAKNAKEYDHVNRTDSINARPAPKHVNIFDTF